MGRKRQKAKRRALITKLLETMEYRALLKQTDIPMLKDDNTIAHLKNSKVMVIMRGLPGSGKSTIVALIKRIHPHTVVCSADDYFLQCGAYHFDRRKLKEAHEACQGKAGQACVDACSPIVIDNTCVHKWEMMHYVKLAQSHSYVVIVICPSTPWRDDPAELAKRNKHGVSQEILQAKLASFEQVLPYYYAWFLNEKGSKMIYNLAENYFNQCLKSVPKLAAQLHSFHSQVGQQLKFKELYQVNSSKILHCTAFFCKGGQFSGVNESGLPYWEWPAVQRGMGRTYALDIIGFVITPRSFGARIRLNDRQMRLWNKDDDEGVPTDMSKITARLDKLSLDAKSRPITSKAGNSDAHLSIFHPTCGPGSRAHLTIGLTYGNNAVQTGLDLINIVMLEEKQISHTSHTILQGAKAKLYDNAQCVIYLDSPIRITTVFTGDY